MKLQHLFVSLFLIAPLAHAQGGDLGNPPEFATLQHALDSALPGTTIHASEFPQPRRALVITRPVTLIGGLFDEPIILDAEADFTSPVRLVRITSRLREQSSPAVWNLSSFNMDVELYGCDILSAGDYGIIGGRNTVSIFDSRVEVLPRFGLALITSFSVVKRSLLRGDVAVSAGVLIHSKSVFDGVKLAADYEINLDTGSARRR